VTVYRKTGHNMVHIYAKKRSINFFIMYQISLRKEMVRSILLITIKLQP